MPRNTPRPWGSLAPAQFDSLNRGFQLEMNQPLPPDSPWDDLELDPREFERSMDTLGLPHDATGRARFGGRMASGGNVDSDRMKLPGHTTDYATGDPLPLRGPAPARFPTVARDWIDFFSNLGRDTKKLFTPQDYAEGGTVEEDIERSRQALDHAWDWIGRPNNYTAPVVAGGHEGVSNPPENSVIGEKMRKRLGVDRRYVDQPERFDIKGSRQLSPELLSEQYWPTPSMRSHERQWKNKYFTDPMTDAIMSVQRNLGKGEDAYKARHFSTGVYNSFTNPVSLPGFIAGAPQFVQNAWQLKDEVPEYISRKAQGKPAHLDWEKVGETFGAAGATPWRQMVSPLTMSGFRPPMGAGRTYDSRPASPFQLQPMPNKPMEISPRQQYQITARKSHGEGMSTDSPIGNVSVSQSGPRRTPTLSIDELNVPAKSINDRMLKSLVGELEYQYPHAVRLNKFSKPLNPQGTSNLQMESRNLSPYEWGYENPMTDVKKKLRDYFFYTRSDPSGMAGGRGNANGGRAYKDGGRVEQYAPFWAR